MSILSAKSIKKENNLEAKLLKIINHTIEANAEFIDETKQFPHKNLEELSKEKITGILVPSQYGGLGQSYGQFSTITQKIAAVCPSTALIFTMHVEATRLINEYGTEEQKQRWLPLASSGSLGTTSTSEARYGGEYWKNAVGAEPSMDGYLINSQKSFTTSSGQADFYIFQTRLSGTEDPEETTYFIVKGNQEGIKSGEWDALGVKGNHSGSLSLVNVYVAKEDRLGKEGQGKKIVHSGTSYLIGLGSVWLGVAEGLFQEAYYHVKKKGLHNHQIIRNELIKAKGYITGLNGWKDSLIRKVEKQRDYNQTELPQELSNELLEFKIATSESANKVAQITMDVTGGFGYKSGRIERLYRDARAGIVMGPSNHLARELISKQIFKEDIEKLRRQ
ncbi:acyl-CoA dehydrogenase family protein [Priestia megaterium]|uniref:acyl-CoA dehydrogenase family protein n=1 Tax=Priestia megaterium TaxID=1404 RepID=UPI000BF42A66|nr:acyl-CoA dehydrogenase family protein [Priestia megaterium]PFT49475.1 acyl-CoA dehydrogenase [Priestia megaterium]